DVEDPTGELSVMIPDNKRQLSGIYERLLPDEVVGITGRLHNDLFIADEIYQPELPIDNKTNSASEPVSVAFLSDIHVGSYLFLEKEFNKFIDCLNLRGNNRELFERVKYLLIAGDLVDGIGIYPNQEEELSIPDIYRQYDFFALLLERIPDYIEIVLCMGNHDAVRNGEPQPRLSKDIGASLYALPNVHVLGNPVMVSIHGVKTLMYHGTSIDTMIGSLAECTYSRPEIAMVEYLKRRHLVPMYGNDSISPEREDYLAIKEIPDILHCGHVHTNGYANYRGVKVINSGTFQARTKYQEEQGHIPTPGRVPIMNLQNHEVSIVHFG
ncbi:MAG TPA: DNA polymerase II small subunit, partial [Candidatus Altiarchaeales archaeon]|nr:DNA polymerase II small subunit [Candidatus Altiarchaeales archaeon]